MAFTDALLDHGDARVAIVDRRDGAGGHWLGAYPFVRLHQASVLYGVASTILGEGQRQHGGPEAGLQERADRAHICAYYSDLLSRRFVPTGRVEFFPSCDYVGTRTFVSRASGREFEVPARCRVVDARYLAPDIPAEAPRRFAVAQGAHVITVNALPRVAQAPSQYVVVGSGKTATDACIWLLEHGVDPDTICWVRPREPWMLDRALIQPDPETFLTMSADVMQTAATAQSLDELFRSLEESGLMLRLDPSVTPTMAKTPTLGRWELDLLRQIDNVVRLGHIIEVGRGRVDLEEGSVVIAEDAIVVDCAADGLKRPPLTPIWGPEAITLQPVRAGFPCFGAAMIGYVEATRTDDEVKNDVCAPSPYPDGLVEWARMNVAGAQNSAKFAAEPDIADWARRVALNPARVPPEHPGSAALDEALARLAEHGGPGVERLRQLSA